MGQKAKTLSQGRRRYRRTFATDKQSETYREAQRFYASKAWRTLREQKINANPLCEQCLSKGRTKPTVDIDHIEPRDVARHRELDWSNLRSLCKACHAAKTRAEHAPSATV